MKAHPSHPYTLASHTSLSTNHPESFRDVKEYGCPIARADCEQKARAHNIMYKTLGFKWLLEEFCPASAFATADRVVARNPQRFIHVTVIGKILEKQKD